MTQLNLTLDQEELLELLAGNRENALKHLVEKILNQVLEMESTEQLCAGNYERSSERQDYRNGNREREFTTKIGTIKLNVPRHRNKPFHTMLFESYQRNEAALITTMAEMVVNGVSTRKVSNVIELICGQEFSKSTVSEACKTLDSEVKAFKNRPLDYEEYPYLMIDATYFKVRENHRVISKAMMIAIGITEDGRKEIIGIDVYDDESNETWLEFLMSLKKRGLKSPIMITSDAHMAIRHAITKIFPESAWQRCQFHFMKNILDAAPKTQRAGLEMELRDIFNSKKIEDARKRFKEVVNDYRDVAVTAVDILENGFEDVLTVYNLPDEMRIALRTSNCIERFNGELKRRSNVIRIFPNKDSVLRLMGSVAIDYNNALLTKKMMFHKKSPEKITLEVKIKMQSIAVAQRQALEAA
ncbi:MAG: IS256 family transposase [Treponema sp.]|nr:IS256 family transposase [Treponema sp.]